MSRPHQITIRLTEDERGWLQSKVTPTRTETDVVRWLIEAERKREEKR